jgi:FMN reductase
MSQIPLIVGLGGTTRSGSTSERAMLTALDRAQALGCETLAFGAGSLPVEPYDPSNPARSQQAQALVAALKRADGVIWVSPAYHGGVSGLMKNAIDFVEDLRTDARVYLQGRAVGSIVCADGPQAMGSTLASLRAIVHSLRGWPTPFGAALNSSTRPFGAEGQAADPAAVQACHTVADEVVMFARLMLAAKAGWILS